MSHCKATSCHNVHRCWFSVGTKTKKRIKLSALEMEFINYLKESTNKIIYQPAEDQCQCIKTHTRWNLYAAMSSTRFAQAGC